MRALTLLVLALALAGCSATQTTPTPPPETTTPTPTPPPSVDAPLRLEPFLSGLDQPLLLLAPPDDSGRLFVVEKGGLVKIVRDGAVAPEPFANVSDLVSRGAEQGLLGMAFVPDFAQSGAVLLSYTDVEGDSVLARYRVSDDPDILDLASAEMLLTVAQPYANHNGGHVAYGPDGMLYYGLGDGGFAGDPHGNGQDPDALLGSILRLDVGAAGPYRIPEDNPYARGGGAPEVWAKGLRNPWRFSFDRQDSHMYIGDVGQNQWEEIDFLPWPLRGGANFGWNAFEGSYRFSPIASPDTDVTGPVAEYSHADGCSVTGGFALRGPSTPALAGQYVYGDYCSGKFWLLGATGGNWTSRLVLDTDLRIMSFGEDAAGEVYVLDAGGRVERLVDG